jgi:feruloyl esterase
MSTNLRTRTLAASALAASSCVSASAMAALTCQVKSIQSAAPADTTIVSAEQLDKPVAHCKIDGYVTTTNPGPNKVNFRLQLPDKSLWKGRYYFIGLGGAAGYVPTDSQIPGGNPIVKGFATAGTDTGRQGSGADWSFLSDPVKALDHIHRGAHVTAVATQQITRAYYGVTKIYRYHSGCSGGGRMGGEAMMMHPEDYDGVLFGQSRLGRTTDGGGSLKFIQASQEMNREPGSWLSPAKLKIVEANVTAACDATDGAVDGVIWDHRLCHYDVASLQCKSGDGPDCLTQPEIKSIKAILNGPRGPDGKLLTQPMPISNMSTWSTFLGSVPPPWSTDSSMVSMSRTSGGFIIATTRAHALFGPNFDILKDFDFGSQKSIDAWNEATAKIGYDRSPDLHPFEKVGGKTILWVGVSDPCCSNLEMEGYVKYLEKDIGKARLDKFAKLYEIPGMGHCGGGTGPGDTPDVLLQSLVDWVELGKVPEGAVMHRGADRVKLIFADKSGPGESGALVPVPTGRSRDFLVCPYPLVSVFDKSKANNPDAVYEAANWSCRASRL